MCLIFMSCVSHVIHNDILLCCKNAYTCCVMGTCMYGISLSLPRTLNNRLDLYNLTAITRDVLCSDRVSPVDNTILVRCAISFVEKLLYAIYSITLEPFRWRSANRMCQTRERNLMILKCGSNRWLTAADSSSIWWHGQAGAGIVWAEKERERDR